MKWQEHPLSINLTGASQFIFDEIEKMSHGKWPINMFKEQFYELEKFKGFEFVYLSPDGAEELQEVKDNGVCYIIGGLVDKVVRKFATLDRANSLNIKSVRLPIATLLKKCKRNALNIDTVATILSAQLKFKDWEKAFNYAMPKRFLKDDVNLDETGNLFKDEVFNLRGLVKDVKNSVLQIE